MGMDDRSQSVGCRARLPDIPSDPGGAGRSVHRQHRIDGSFTSGPYQATYKATKAGVVALSECLANEFEIEYPHVGVAVLSPAYTSTSIRNDERNAPPGHIPRAVADPRLNERRESVYSTLEQEGISPAEIAGMVVAGMAARKTHIFPHPQWFEAWQQRVDKVRSQL